MSARAESGTATVRLPVAVLAVVAAVVVALLAIWATTTLQVARLPTDPPRNPPAGSPAATTLVLTNGRDVSFQEFTVTLPGPPFACAQTTSTPSAQFPSFAFCSRVVHADFDGAGHDWSATTGVGLLDESVVKPSLPETAEAAFTALVDVSYRADDHPRVSKVSREAVQVSAPTGSTATYQANVNVSPKGLATPYDRVVVVVLALRSGRHLAFFSEFPHDGDKEALAAVVASVGTISARG